MKTSRKPDVKYLGNVQPHAYLPLKETNENSRALTEFLKGREYQTGTLDDLWIFSDSIMPLEAYQKSCFIEFSFIDQ